jgi:endoglucanase
VNHITVRARTRSPTSLQKERICTSTFLFLLSFVIWLWTYDSFRLPFGWQYMVGNNQASTSLDPTFLGKYDILVQAVLNSGGYAMLDLHNYARWNGGIVGQGGPSNDNVSALSLKSRRMADDSLLVFGACLPRSMRMSPRSSLVSCLTWYIRKADQQES